MGIYYEIVGVFGVSYSFEELVNFLQHEDTKILSDDIGCDDLQNFSFDFSFKINTIKLITEFDS